MTLMETNMTMKGAVETTCAFPHVCDTSDKRAARVRLGIRRLASVDRAIQGTTLSATGFGQLGQVAGYRAPVGVSTTNPFITTSLDALQFRTTRPPV
ncbi:hypothetical protein [Lapillicoccus sp.]|uniref:hypothetical protein n=1 Tax=Lapillicoccus sp. TaxID=1909287 RepID=UPI0032631157